MEGDSNASQSSLARELADLDAEAAAMDATVVQSLAPTDASSIDDVTTVRED